jgi:hypothetical protein
MTVVAIITVLFVIALATLLLPVIDSRYRQQRIADQHWHEVEHE